MTENMNPEARLGALAQLVIDWRERAYRGDNLAFEECATQLAALLSGGTPEAARPELPTFPPYDKDRDNPLPAPEVEPYEAALIRRMVRAENREAELIASRREGCTCVCHSYPEHGKLQDALEALKWHQEKLADAAPIPRAEKECR